MPETPAKLLITGPPHSGKTHFLVEHYLQSLTANVLMRRAFIVPNVSYREHIKGVILRQGGLDVLPEHEILTLAEFLYNLARTQGLLPVRRMSPLEELAVLRILAQKAAQESGVEVAEGAAGIEALHENLLVLRHAGLFLRWLRESPEQKALQASKVATDDFLLLLALRFFNYMQESGHFDGLLGQELAVAALTDVSGVSLAGMPGLLLIDGFYDLNELAREAVAGMNRVASGFVLALPEIPADERTADLIEWARKKLMLSEQELPRNSSSPLPLLSQIAGAKAHAEGEVRELPQAFTVGSLQVQSFATYLAEAESIADRVLALHRREGTSLDSFLVVLSQEEPEFQAALESEFEQRDVPLVDLVGVPQGIPLTAFLSSVLSYLANPDGDTTEALILACVGHLDALAAPLFRELYRFRGFVTPALGDELLTRAGCTKTLELMKKLDELRSSFNREPRWESLAELLCELSQQFLEWQSATREGDAAAWQEAARTQQLVERLPMLLRQGALENGLISASGAEDMLALAQQALALPCALGREQYSGVVYVVDALVARQWQKPYVFIPRVDADHWPGKSMPVLFSDALRERLQDGGTRLRTRREEYEFRESLFLSAVARSTHRTFVTYARRTVDGKEVLASPFLHLLAAAAEEETAPAQTSSQPGMTIFSPVNRRELALRSAIALRFGAAGKASLTAQAGAAVLARLGDKELSDIFAHGSIASEPADFSLPSARGRLPGLLSPSALTQYRKCPYLYFADWLMTEASRLEALEEGLTPADIGRAIHKALQEALTAYPREVDVMARFRDSLVAIAGLKRLLRLFELELESELDRWRTPLERFYRCECERLERDELQPVILESDLRTPLTDTEGAGFELHGFPDRVDASADGKEFFVYDYKSGTESGFSGGEGRLVRSGVDLAGLCYSLLVARMKGLGELPVFTYLLVRDNQRRQVSARPVEGDSVEAALTNALGASAASLRAGRFSRAPHREVDCASCDFYQLCRRDRFRESLPNEVEQWFPLEVTLR